jgi:hypothetical protein
VVVLEAAATIGGVWAEHRLYPGLKSNNMLGTYEYSDFPMDEPTFGVKPGEHIPGHVLHGYLKAYAEKFGVYRRIRFCSKVETVEEQPEVGWLVSVVSRERGTDRARILTKKLIVATGLTSKAFLPEFEGEASFNAPLFHFKEFLAHSETLKTAKSVVVFGGAKSGWDVAYTYASSGVAVEWVIRSSGHGPMWMSPPYVTPLKKWLEKLAHTRFLTWFSPCIWGDADGYSVIRRFLHNTVIGRWIVDRFWHIVANDVIQLNNYTAHPETAKLKPWTNPFFIGTGISILNYPSDFFDFVRNGQIKIHIADISYLSRRTVHLSSGIDLHTDVLVCATGWQHSPPITFLPKGLEASLGLPHYSSDPDKLALQADAEITNRFPVLRIQPKPNSNYKPLPRNKSTRATPNQPYRLYRFMVPPSQAFNHSIGFAGMLASISTPLVAQTQALWLTAYLDDKLQLNRSQDDINWETMLYSQFGKWRYPVGYGARFPDFVFDALPYLDMLLHDLQLTSHRKTGWLADWFEPYGPGDYKHLVEEWRNIRGSE